MNLNTGLGTDTLNISDFGDNAADTYTLNFNAGTGATELAFADGDDAIDIIYDANGTSGQLENFNLVGSPVDGNIYNINKRI